MNLTQKEKDTLIECMQYFKTFRNFSIPSLMNYNEYNDFIDKISQEKVVAK